MNQSTIFERVEQGAPPLAITVDVETSFAKHPDVFAHSIQEMLAVLASRKVSVTAFVQGEALQTHPDLLQLLQDGGHEVGSHGFRHQDQRGLSREELREDIEKALEQFAQAGVPCVGYRAPFFCRNAELSAVLLDLQVPWDSSISRIHFPGRYDNRLVPALPYLDEHGLLQLPIARVNAYLPYGLEHMKALGALYPQRRPTRPAIFYMHNYSFSDRYTRPWYNRRHNVERSSAVLDRVLKDREPILCTQLLENTSPSS